MMDGRWAIPIRIVKPKKGFSSTVCSVRLPLLGVHTSCSRSLSLSVGHCKRTAGRDLMGTPGCQLTRRIGIFLDNQLHLLIILSYSSSMNTKTGCSAAYIHIITFTL